MDDSAKTASPASVSTSCRMSIELLDLTPTNIKRIIHYKKDETPPNDLTLPQPLYALVEHIINCCPTLRKNSNTINTSPRAFKNKKKVDWYEKNFGHGKISFVVPMDDRGPMSGPPDPLYHFIEGVILIIARWELSCPHQKLFCVNPNTDIECKDGEMIKQPRQTVTKAQHHIYDNNGSRCVVFTISYKCNCCGYQCLGTSPEMLNKLPTYMSSQYPVDEKCAGGGKQQLHRSLTREFECLGITHITAMAMANYIREAAGQRYIDATADYFSMVKAFGGVSDYPNFKDYMLGADTPPGKLILDKFRESYVSTHTLSGISDKSRCTREVQGVTSRITYTQDHTYQVVKNYNGEVRKRAKAAFTAMVETGEVACVALVPTEKQKDYAHAVEQMARRQEFAPLAYWWSDVYPHGKLFMIWMFGSMCLGHLGLFHF